MRASLFGYGVLAATLGFAPLAVAQEDTAEEATSDEAEGDEPKDDEADADEPKDDEEKSDEATDDADERTAPNAIYLDLLGAGGLYSVNYDRAFGDLAVRAGFSYFSVTAASGTQSATATLITVPLTASYIGIGSKTHIFELGGGMTMMFLGAGADGFYGGSEADANASVILPVGTVLAGYRLQPKNGGFMFRIGASPLFGPGGTLPWGYLSFGGAF